MGPIEGHLLIIEDPANSQITPIFYLLQCPIETMWSKQESSVPPLK